MDSLSAHGQHRFYPNELDLRLSVDMFRSGPFAENARLLLQKKQLVATEVKSKRPTIHRSIPQCAPHKLILSHKAGRCMSSLCDGSLQRSPTRRDGARKRLRWTPRGSSSERPGSNFHIKAGAITTHMRRHKSSTSLDFRKGDVLTVTNKQLVEKETQPPQRWGQGQFIKKMDELGLGTKAPATRSSRNSLSGAMLTLIPFVPPVSHAASRNRSNATPPQLRNLR